MHADDEVRLNIKLPRATRERLRQMAKAHDRGMSWLMRQMINEEYEKWMKKRKRG